MITTNTAIPPFSYMLSRDWEEIEFFTSFYTASMRIASLLKGGYSLADITLYQRINPSEEIIKAKYIILSDTYPDKNTMQETIFDIFDCGSFADTYTAAQSEANYIAGEYDLDFKYIIIAIQPVPLKVTIELG